MAGKGIPEKGGFNGVTGVAGGSAKGVLLVLLALAVCVGYFYYFTDMLRPKEETPLQSEVYPAEVKKPLPARPSQPGAANPDETVATVPPAPAPQGQPSSPAVSQPSGGNTPQVAANTTARQGEVPVAPAPKTARQPSTAVDKRLPPPGVPQQATSRPVTAAAGKPKDAAGTVKTTARPEQAKSSAKPSKPAEKPSTVAAKPAPETVKPATAKQKTAAAKPVSKEPAKSSSDKKETVAGAKKETVVPSGKGAGDKKQKTAATGPVTAKAAKAEAGAPLKTSGRQGGDYTLIVGTYVLKSTLLAAKAKLELAGFKPVVTPGRKKSEPMNRLLLAEFASYSSASSELQRVKKSSRDAFILQENGRYALYAGSYFDQGRASQEQDRLRKEGFAPIVKKSSAPVMTYTLSSGDFATREQAEKEAARLRKLGFKPLPAPMKQ